mgnify:CR=1 FL=1
MMRQRHIRYALLATGLIALLGTSRAQQDPMYSQYMFNVLAYNPAYAGSADVFTMMALSRHQWVGFDGAPSTQTLAIHSPLPGQKLALGFSAMNDVVGPVHRTSAHVDLAYRIQTGVNTRLAFGLKGGLDLFQADLATLPTVQADPSSANIQGAVLPNFGFGLFWHSPTYYLGLSTPKLMENEISSVSGNVMTTSTEARHYFLIGGYVFDMGQDLKFKPSFMLRAVEGAPMSLDLNANFLLRERIWMGVMYRVTNAFGVMAQYRINEQMRLGYGFDMTTTKLGAYNAGTHELMLSYDMRFSKGRTISPRYF